MSEEYDPEFGCYGEWLGCTEGEAEEDGDYAEAEETRINEALQTWKRSLDHKPINSAPPTDVVAHEAHPEEVMPKKKKVPSPDTSPTTSKDEVVYKGGGLNHPQDSISGRSIKELYFFDLQHTRELYKNFDVKLQVLYVLMRSPYGIAINQLRRHIGLRGNNDHVREKIKDALCFWNGVGLASVVYDGTVGTMPSPMLWECTDAEKAKELLSAIALTHTALKTEALRNGGIEKLYLANRNSTYCISVGKKTRRTV